VTQRLQKKENRKKNPTEQVVNAENKNENKPGTMAHTCNPSYSGGRDQEHPV
jgi:hypothetical protein